MSKIKKHLPRVLVKPATGYQIPTSGGWKVSKQSIPSTKETAITENAKFMAKVPDALLLGDTEGLEKGFTARGAVIASMPHSKPKDHVFKRRNGNYTLTMIADPDVGLPYGALPRLLLAWITTEAVRTKSPTLTLGKSLADFMRELDIEPTGGKKGTITMLREQMNRLFKTIISCDYSTDAFDKGLNMALVEKYELWWTPKDPEQPGLGESVITLGQAFFQEITKSPIPFYMEALKALRKSPLALDIYLWLTYKNSYAKHITSIPWESLQAQFGADYAKDAQGRAHFKSRFLSALKKVAVVYPEVHKMKALDEGLLLVPALPHVPKTTPKSKKP